MLSNKKLFVVFNQLTKMYFDKWIIFAERTHHHGPSQFYHVCDPIFPYCQPR